MDTAYNCIPLSVEWTTMYPYSYRRFTMTIIILCVYIYIYITTTTQCKLLERKWSMCTNGWKEKDRQRKFQWIAPSPVQGMFGPMADRKCHQCNLQPVTTTMCASGVLALVNRRVCKDFLCPYASCSDCCIMHAVLILVGGGGVCSWMLFLHPLPTYTDAGLDLCTFCPDLCTLHLWCYP